MPAARRHLPAFTSPAQQQTKQRGNGRAVPSQCARSGHVYQRKRCVLRFTLEPRPMRCASRCSCFAQQWHLLNAPHAPFYPDLLRVSSGKHSPGGVYGRSFYEWMGYNKNSQALLRLETEQHYLFALSCLFGALGCSSKLNGETALVALAEVQALLFRKLARKNW